MGGKKVYTFSMRWNDDVFAMRHLPVLWSERKHVIVRRWVVGRFFEGGNWRFKCVVCTKHLFIFRTLPMGMRKHQFHLQLLLKSHQMHQSLLRFLPFAPQFSSMKLNLVQTAKENQPTIKLALKAMRKQAMQKSSMHCINQRLKNSMFLT